MSGYDLGMSTIDVASAADIPPGGRLVHLHGDTPIAIFNDEGVLYALDDRCPHANAPLSDGDVEDGMVICPLHGWEFKLADGSCPLVPNGTRTYPVRVENGRVLLEV